MSIYKQTLNEFIHFLKTEPSWFSESDRNRKYMLVKKEQLRS